MSRYYGGSSEEHQPITWVRGYGIYATHVVVAVYVFSMILTALAIRPGIPYFMEALPFASNRVWNGEVWRLLTYGLVNPPSLRFAIDMVMTVWFGREVEKHLGRKTFLTLYGGMYLATPVVLTIVGLGLPTGFVGATGALAVFTAFATIYPNVPLFFNILAKWAAVILVGIFTLIHFSSGNESALFSLLGTNAFAFLFIRHHQGLFELPRIRLWRRKPRLRVLPDLKPQNSRRTEKPGYAPAPKPDAMAEVDALLDKIATSGISSLTPDERAKLEAAREGLIKRGSSRD